MPDHASAQRFGPDQIRVAYNVQPLLDRHIDGSGRTIVIVDAYGSPALAQNLHNWDTLWGIPDPVLDIRTPFGIDPTDVLNAFGWGFETSLDVEWAHAIAPAAKIVLVVAKSNNDADINAALTYAVDNNVGDVISMSFGEGETCMAPADRANLHATFEAAARKNITLLASSGDQGAASRRATAATRSSSARAFRRPTRTSPRSAGRTCSPTARAVRTSRRRPGTRPRCSGLLQRAAVTAFSSGVRATRRLSSKTRSRVRFPTSPTTPASTEASSF